MTFADLNLSKQLLNAIGDLGLQYPTAIQEKAFSPIMAGRDVLGIAQTGTGKTFAYLLPVLRQWKFKKSPFPQILVVVPTRELVAQVVEEIEKLSVYMNVVSVGAYGGTSMRIQKARIEAGVDIVVGTPGRLVDLFLDGVLKPKLINKLIVDEVDEMLHLGFRTQLKTILDFLPERRQNLMFSATLEEEVEAVISLFSDRYEKIEAAPSGAPLENIDQYAYEVPNFNTKANLLDYLLERDPQMSKVLVFAGTKRIADALYKRMSTEWEEKVGVIHSSKAQNNRFATVEKFQNGTYRFIIATDLIARGLDITGVTHIVNFDLTETAEQYIHRIGRTGRAEKQGIAISFISEKETNYKLAIESLMDMTIAIKPFPAEDLITDELIDLEKEVEFVPFNNHKMKAHEPSGPAFHEKIDKNKKVNNKIRREEQMKIKYKKPKKRGMKQKKKK
ncbi:MAG: ATP-dependent RNA helicase RhlE [Saprospiraceae bacterium]|jgi:ATP-dependent RNA helicase RhlE